MMIAVCLNYICLATLSYVMSTIMLIIIIEVMEEVGRVIRKEQASHVMFE